VQADATPAQSSSVSEPQAQAVEQKAITYLPTVESQQ
jgi:hypothetical protein